MAGKTAAAKTAVKRSREKPKTVVAEAAEPLESHRPVGAVLRRCAEARGTAPEPNPTPREPPKKPSARSREACARFVQREMSRALPRICEMLLTECVQKQNLAALRGLVQLAVFYGVKGASAAAKVPTGTGFARRVMEEFQQRTAAAAEGSVDGAANGRIDTGSFTSTG